MTPNIQAHIDAIRKRTDFVPRIALVLGSGLGSFADEITPVAEIPYDTLPGFPVSTVAGHAGRFLLGTVADIPVICMQGRVHYYEGYAMEDVAAPFRVMYGLGARTLVLTNASGGINPAYEVGSLVAITDQIASFVPSPLIGKNDDEEGPRFTDMTKAYDEALTACLHRVAKAQEIPLGDGVYLQLSGPSFETPAEIRMCRILGADMVGMSTAVECLVARHLGFRTCGISLITNLAAGISPEPLSHEDVSRAGKAAEPRFRRLLAAAIPALYQEDNK